MFFGRVDAHLVHELDGHGNDARAYNVGDAGARSFGAVKTHKDRARTLRGRDNPEPRLGDDAKLAFGATDQPKDVIARRFEMRPADLDDFALGSHHLDAHQVVCRHAVLQAVCAARVHRNVPGDRTGKLRGRVGRIEEPLPLHRASNGKIGHAGLHMHDAVGVIGFDHLVHSGDTKDHAVGCGQRSTGQRGPCSARHDRHAFSRADPDRSGDFFGCAWQNHGERRTAIGRERVTLVSAHFLLGMDHAVRSQRGFQKIDNLCALGQNCGIGRRHLHRRTPYFGKFFLPHCLTRSNGKLPRRPQTKNPAVKDRRAL